MWKRKNSCHHIPAWWWGITGYKPPSIPGSSGDLQHHFWTGFAARGSIPSPHPTPHAPQHGEEGAALPLLPLFSVCQVTKGTEHWTASNSDITNLHPIYSSDSEQQALYRFNIIKWTLEQTKFPRGMYSSSLVPLDGCGVLFKLTLPGFPTYCRTRPLIHPRLVCQLAASSDSGLWAPVCLIAGTPTWRRGRGCLRMSYLATHGCSCNETMWYGHVKIQVFFFLLSYPWSLNNKNYLKIQTIHSSLIFLLVSASRYEVVLCVKSTNLSKWCNLLAQI